MEKINFEDGRLIKGGYVIIDGVEYEIIEPQYEGNTPLSSFVLNKMQDNIEADINIVQVKDREMENRLENLEELKTKLRRYSGNLDNLNENGYFAGNPCTGYPERASNGWGYIFNLVININESFQQYIDKENGDIWQRRKKVSISSEEGVWSEWKSKEINIATGQEIATNEFIDGKQIFKKLFKINQLQNTAGNTVIDTKLNNINFEKLEGSINNNSNIASNIPFKYTGQPEIYHYFSATNNTITIRVTGDASAFSAVETLYYTKN